MSEHATYAPICVVCGHWIQRHCEWDSPGVDHGPCDKYHHEFKATKLAAPLRPEGERPALDLSPEASLNSAVKAVASLLKEVARLEDANAQLGAEVAQFRADLARVTEERESPARRR